MHLLKGLKNKSRISDNLFKLIITAITLALFVGLFYPFFTASKTVEITKVIDGDTVEVRLNGNKETVRLKGVDTPETSGYNAPEEYKGVPKGNWKCLQNWGYGAKSFVEGKIDGKEITLSYRKAVLGVERGSFGRLIGKIYPKGSDSSLNKELVQKGYARSYGDYYESLEIKARENSKGLWECAN